MLEQIAVRVERRGGRPESEAESGTKRLWRDQEACAALLQIPVGRLAIPSGSEPLDHHGEIGRIQEVEVFRSLGNHDRRSLLFKIKQGLSMITPRSSVSPSRRRGSRA